MTPEREAEIRAVLRRGAYPEFMRPGLDRDYRMTAYDLLDALDAMRQERDEAVWHRDDFARIAAIEATRASELYDAKLQAEQERDRALAQPRHDDYWEDAAKAAQWETDNNAYKLAQAAQRVAALREAASNLNELAKKRVDWQQGGGYTHDHQPDYYFRTCIQAVDDLLAAAEPEVT